MISHVYHARDKYYQEQHLFWIIGKKHWEKFPICVNTLIYAFPSPTRLFKMGYGERWVRLKEIIIAALLITLRASMVLCLSTCDKNQYYQRRTNRSVINGLTTCWHLFMRNVPWQKKCASVWNKHRHFAIATVNLNLRLENFPTIIFIRHFFLSPPPSKRWPPALLSYFLLAVHK